MHSFFQQPLKETVVDSNDQMLDGDVKAILPNRLQSTPAAQRAWLTIEKRQADRQKLKQERCQTNGPWSSLNTQDIDTMMVDLKHEAAFCAVAKTASTSWTTKLLHLTGNGHLPPQNHVPFIQSNKSELTYINNFSPERGQQIVNSFYTFTFVREPWERLLSCWYSTVKPYKRRQFYGNAGATEFLSRFSENQLDEMIPFPEFLDYIATTKDGLATANKHWRPIYLVSMWWRHDKEMMSTLLSLCGGVLSQGANNAGPVFYLCLRTCLETVLAKTVLIQVLDRWRWRFSISVLDRRSFFKFKFKFLLTHQHP